MNVDQFDQAASTVNDLQLIADMKAKPPPLQFSHDLLKRMKINVHEHWKDSPQLNGELIVIVDKNGALTAMGYPHCNSMVLLERRVTKRVAVHSIGNSIVGGMYDLVKMANMINGDWAWDPNIGMTVGTFMRMTESAK